METLDKIRRRIDTTEELESVVRTMKALAAVSIRQYERAVEALGDYRRSIEMGLQIVLQKSPAVSARATEAPWRRAGVIVFGSDQGMCGPLNDRVVGRALELVRRLRGDHQRHLFLAVGGRVASRLAEAGEPLSGEVRLPSSIPAITTQVQQVLAIIDDWRSGERIDRLLLVYSRHLSRSSSRPEAEHLLPLDREWLDSLREREWPTHALPFFTMDVEALFSALIRQYLFIGLYRAFAESLASENASRLASMRRAEQNIGERLDELKRSFNQQRQLAVTSELLDIVSAYEALGEEEP